MIDSVLKRTLVINGSEYCQLVINEGGFCVYILKKIIQFIIDKGSNIFLLKEDSMTETHKIIYHIYKVYYINGLFSLHFTNLVNLIKSNEFFNFIAYIKLHKFNINSQYNHIKITLFMVAMKENKDRFVYWLLNERTNIDLIDADKRNILYYISDKSNIKIIKRICRKTTHINHQDKSGFTWLHYFILNQSRSNLDYFKSLVQLFVKYGGNLNLNSDANENIIDICLRKKFKIEQEFLQGLDDIEIYKPLYGSVKYREKYLSYDNAYK
jgi:ankyrin repeat protein